MKNLDTSISVNINEIAEISQAMNCLDNTSMGGNGTYRFSRTRERIKSAYKSAVKANGLLLEKYGIKDPKSGGFYIPKEGTPEWDASESKHEDFNEFYVKQADLSEEKVEVEIFPIAWETIFPTEETVLSVNKNQLATLLEHGILAPKED